MSILYVIILILSVASIISLASYEQ